MKGMTIAEYTSTDFDLDRQIEQLVSKQVHGQLSPEEKVSLVRLSARRSRNMRPTSKRLAYR
jgi:hypothetical protein